MPSRTREEKGAAHACHAPGGVALRHAGGGDELNKQVVDYIEAEGITVTDWRALEVADNAEVGCIPGERVMEAARSLDLTDVDALVISCCVQMPSLSLVQAAEDELGLPVLSAATAGAYSILRSLGLPVDIPGAGSLLRADPALAAR